MMKLQQSAPQVVLQDPDNPTLEEVADLCRAAHDEILIHGWRAGPTPRGGAEGLCLGSALAKPLGLERPLEDPVHWAYEVTAGESWKLCPAGVIFSHTAKAVAGLRGQALLYAWNDSHSQDEVLDLLMNVEKDLREQAASASTA